MAVELLIENKKVKQNRLIPISGNKFFKKYILPLETQFELTMLSTMYYGYGLKPTDLAIILKEFQIIIDKESELDYEENIKAGIINRIQSASENLKNYMTSFKDDLEYLEVS